MKKEGKHWNCFKMLKSAVMNEDDMSIGGRTVMGIFGLLGTIIVDPAVYACDKLGFSGKSDDEDYYNPDDHIYPG